MASIKDVARQAGVAISTVSKVLNGYEGVSESTKDKVNAAIEALNYTPNAVAAALSSKQFGRVALLLKLEETVGCVDEINLQYLSGAIHRAKELKLDVVTLFFSMVADMGLDELTSYLKAQSVEGIIAYGMNEEDEFLREFTSDLMPFPTEIIMMTEEIPMIIPSIVRTDRPLLLLIFISAILIYSQTCDIYSPFAYCITGFTCSPSIRSISEEITTVSPSLTPSLISTSISLEIPVTTFCRTITPSFTR